MNTPAHIVANLLVLTPKDKPKFQLVTVVGAILPDLPMFIFYFFEKVVWNTPEYLIWTQRYYQEGWQNFIDTFNSVPLMILGLVIAWWVKSKMGLFFFGSMMLHVLGDFPLHHDDAHRHFFPFSDWRFESPLSYWDPHYYGNFVAPLEMLMVIIGSIFLFRYSRSSFTKFLVGGGGFSYMVYLSYAIWVWA